jgi:DHA2 family multidrug resistance protein
MAKGAPLATAQRQAMGAMEGTLMKQASMLAYNDAWMLILLSFVIVMPAVFLLRRPKGPVALVDAH